MMSPLNYMKMMVSFHDGWDEIHEIHPEIARTFFLLVMPFLLIPPGMLLMAGNFHASAYLINAPFSRWEEVSVAFLITELFTVPLMGWVIQRAAALHNVQSDFKDTFLLAAIAAVPLWLSSLALMIPHLGIMIAIVVLGFLASISMLYHGIYTILGISDPQKAKALSISVFTACGLLWAVVCAFVVLRLMY